MAVSGEDLLDYGEKYIGTPYVWGGNSLTSGVDCSGLIQQVYKNFGIAVPRTTYDMIGQGQAVSIDKLQVGDLVFFSAGAGGKSPDHVAMYAGNGQMLEAPRPGEAVRLTSFTQSYYASRFVGARRISGVTNSAGQSTYSTTDTNNTVVKLDPQELASEYGFAYSFLQHNPDLKGLFNQAVAGNWTADKFTAELQGTNWYKENSDTARQSLMEQSTDPSTYNAKLTAMTTQIQQMAGQMGAVIPASKLGGIAKTAIMTNLDEGGLENLLGGYVKFQNNGTLGGAAGAFQSQITQYASQMGVGVTDQSVKNQAQLIARGLMTSDDAMENIRQSAISAYPAYADQINGGSTIQDIAQPYTQVASTVLEQPDTSYTVNSPIIQSALNKMNQQGQPTGMSLTDFEQSLKASPQWLGTQNAQDSLMAVGHSVLQNLGVAT